MTHEALKGFFAGAAALTGGALALGACFTLRPDVAPGAGDAGDSGGDETPGADAPAACQPTTTGCDFTVDPSADAGGCPFRTIGAAVAVAQASSCSKSPTVHVAAGTYSADAGETFPIEARGVSIVGAGQDLTTVSGAGPVKVSLPTNDYGPLSTGGAVVATFLVGQSAAPTSIEDLTIAPPPPAIAGSENREAIVCDRGNASATPTAPNTTINRVTISGFDVGVRVTWARPPATQSGCNAMIVNSSLSDGSFGVIADGDGVTTGGNQVVSVHLGDSVLGGNTLLDFDFSRSPISLGGAGIAICDGVTGAVVQNNKFSKNPGNLNDMAVWIVQRDYDPNGIDIENNTIGPALNEGVNLMGKVAVTRFVNNTVQNVSMVGEAQYGWLGIGLAVGLEGFPGIPYVAYARGNTFVGNDVAVEFRSTLDALPSGSSGHNDFGTQSDPGNNTFQCNSGWSTTPGGGGDVYMMMRTAGAPTVVVPFEGNSWDHAPPTALVSNGDTSKTPQGIDVLEYGVPADGADGGLQTAGGALDTAGAKSSPVSCPAMRVAGP